MKKQILLLPFLVIALIFTGCSDDDPIPVNEQELITTVEVNLSDGTNSYTLSMEDPDGDGPGEPTVTGATIPPGTYSGDIQLFNKTLDPSDDEYVVTVEILEEDLDHQFFFSASSELNVTTAYTDMDSAGNPIGQQFSMTAVSGSGIFNVTLIHEPIKGADGVYDGDITNAAGATDVNIDFPVTIE